MFDCPVMQPVGCDRMLGSDEEFDACRVCGGDGSSCTPHQGRLETDQLKKGVMLCMFDEQQPCS